MCRRCACGKKTVQERLGPDQTWPHCLQQAKRGRNGSRTRNSCHIFQPHWRLLFCFVIINAGTFRLDGTNWWMGINYCCRSYRQVNSSKLLRITCTVMRIVCFMAITSQARMLLIGSLERLTRSAYSSYFSSVHFVPLLWLCRTILQSFFHIVNRYWRQISSSIDKKGKFSRKRLNEDEGDITYINERNRVFNKKVRFRLCSFEHK